MIDAITAAFLVAATVGACAAIAHMFGYVPPRYKRVLSDLQAKFASQVGAEVENSFRRIYAEQEIKLKAEADAMMAQASQADKSLQMTMTGALGNAAQLQNKTTRMMAEAMLGQWLPALRMLLPSVAEQLEENPELIFSILDNPYFKKHIEPRIRGYLGDNNNTAQLTSGAGGWVG